MHLKLLDRVVSSACFLTGGVFECHIAHRRSVAVLYMLYKFRYNPMYPLYGALPWTLVSVLVTCGELVAHRYPYTLLRCRTSLYLRIFIPLTVSLWNIVVTPHSMVWDWRVSRAGPMPFCWPSSSLPFVSYCFHFLFCYSIGCYCGAGVFELIGC